MQRRHCIRRTHLSNHPQVYGQVRCNLVINDQVVSPTRTAFEAPPQKNPPQTSESFSKSPPDDVLCTRLWCTNSFLHRVSFKRYFQPTTALSCIIPTRPKIRTQEGPSKLTSRSTSLSAWVWCEQTLTTLRMIFVQIETTTQGPITNIRK